MGAECAMKLSRGGMALLASQLASLYELLGEGTKLLPVLRLEPEKPDGSHTAKHVG
jgi:hypothetical protein